MTANAGMILETIWGISSILFTVFAFNLRRQAASREICAGVAANPANRSKWISSRSPRGAAIPCSLEIKTWRMG